VSSARPRVGALAVALASALALLGTAPEVGAATDTNDTQLAAQATVGLPDFPTDSTWDGHATSAADAATQKTQDDALAKFPACAALRQAYRSLYATATSGSSYKTADSAQSVDDFVGVFTSAKEAQRYTDAYRSPKAARCFRSNLEQGSDTALAAHATVQPLPKAIRNAGTTGFGTRIKFSFTSQGTPGVQYLDFIALRKGRSTASFTFARNAEPFPTVLETKLLDDVASRLPTK
jgi:hypothetical protein